MTLHETLASNLKDAMKSGDTFTRDTLRLVQSALKNTALEKRKDVLELSAQEAMEVLKRLVKQRKESITQYVAGGRQELADQEQAEIEVLNKYLPKEMDEENLRTVVEEALRQAGISEKKDMGKAMGVAINATKGAASGDRVKKLVEAILQ